VILIRTVPTSSYIRTLGFILEKMIFRVTIVFYVVLCDCNHSPNQKLQNSAIQPNFSAKNSSSKSTVGISYGTSIVLL